jgi:hypothetical protein
MHYWKVVHRVAMAVVHGMTLAKDGHEAMTRILHTHQDQLNQFSKSASER